MLSVTVEVVFASAVLVGGSWIVWRRRDNVFGYLALGLIASRYLVPLVPTISAFEGREGLVRLYADILAAGGLAFLVGLGVGSLAGRRAATGRTRVLGLAATGAEGTALARRTRLLAVAGLVLLVGALGVMGYVPFFEADRVSAKYGVGVYRGAFSRASILYRLGLALCSVALPLVLAVLYRWRQRTDAALALALFALLFLTLSRESAFLGPAAFGIAVLIERRHRPVTVGTVAVGVFLAGTLASLAFVGVAELHDGRALAARVTASAPDMRDQIGFMAGFEADPEPTYGRTLVAGISLGSGSYWDPATYALRTLTGIEDLRDFGSGGVRLPPPIWGYASFGWTGVLGFSALSGLFTGWGLMKIRRLVTPLSAGRGYALTLVVAYVFFQATYGLAAEFYFVTTAALVELAATLWVVGWLHRRPRPEVALPLKARAAPEKVEASDGDDKDEPVEAQPVEAQPVEAATSPAPTGDGPFDGIIADTRRQRPSLQRQPKR